MNSSFQIMDYDHLNFCLICNEQMSDKPIYCNCNICQSCNTEYIITKLNDLVHTNLEPTIKCQIMIVKKALISRKYMNT